MEYSFHRERNRHRASWKEQSWILEGWPRREDHLGGASGCPSTIFAHLGAPLLQDALSYPPSKNTCQKTYWFLKLFSHLKIFLELLKYAQHKIYHFYLFIDLWSWEKNVNFLFYLFMHLLLDSWRCPDQGPKVQCQLVGMMLQLTELPWPGQVHH